MSTLASVAAEGRAPALEVAGLAKRFGGTQALAKADLTVLRGEIHAFLGANGAGKSTLIRILAGVHRADAGEIRLAGAPIEPSAQASRISFVHQDLGLIESMTVGENMAMVYGYPRRRWNLIDWRAVRAKAQEMLDRLGASLPLDRPVAELTQAERSIVAIARALAGSVDLLVLDEPTASLPQADVERLFGTLERLRERDVAVLYVTHRLDEVFRIADAATVLRDGRTVAVYRPLDLAPEQLIADIVGHVPAPRALARPAAGAAPVLQADDLRAGNAGPVSFRIGRGEIVGLAGLRGQGQEAIGRALGGIMRLAGGTMRLGGRTVSFANPAEAIAAGIGFVSGRRAEEGLARTMTVKENLFLNPLNFGAQPLVLRSNRAEASAAIEILSRFRVTPARPDRPVMTLSGGNQQKVVIARWAGRGYKLLVLEDPTMGVDFGAKAEVYRILARDAAEGTACVIVSPDLDELVEVCDRVLVFSRGRIVAELRRSELTTSALTRAVSGIGTEATGTGKRPDGRSLES